MGKHFLKIQTSIIHQKTIGTILNSRLYIIGMMRLISWIYPRSTGYNEYYNPWQMILLLNPLGYKQLNLGTYLGYLSFGQLFGKGKMDIFQMRSYITVSTFIEKEKSGPPR